MAFAVIRLYSECLFIVRSGNEFLIDLSGMVVRGSCLGLLSFCIGVLLGLPALFDSGQTPAGAVDRASDGLAIHDDVDRIGVRVREDADGSPAAFLERVPERDISYGTVSLQTLIGNRVTVDDQFC